MSDIKYIQKEFTKGSAAVIKYRNLLKKYGYHLGDCMLEDVNSHLRIGWKKCSCGWTELKKEEGWNK